MRHWFASAVTALACVAASPGFAQDVRVPALASATASAMIRPAPAVVPDDGETNIEGEGVTRAASGATVAGDAQVPFLQPTRTALPSVSSLITGLRDDFRNTATTDNAVIMLAASASASLIHPYDARISQALTSSPGAATFFAAGQIVGGFAVQFGGAWAAYGIGRAIAHERTAVVGADLVRAQLVNSVFTQGLKLTINRARPDGDPWSFPSGHSSGTFANAAVLHRHFGWKVGAPAYAVATYVAASRIQERRHFASDVIFGAGVGLISGRAVTVGRGSHRFAVSPMGLPGGAGVSFTRITN